MGFYVLCLGFKGRVYLHHSYNSLVGGAARGEAEAFLHKQPRSQGHSEEYGQSVTILTRRKIAAMLATTRGIACGRGGRGLTHAEEADEQAPQEQRPCCGCVGVLEVWALGFGVWGCNVNSPGRANGARGWGPAADGGGGGVGGGE